MDLQKALTPGSVGKKLRGRAERFDGITWGNIWETYEVFVVNGDLMVI